MTLSSTLSKAARFRCIWNSRPLNLSGDVPRIGGGVLPKTYRSRLVNPPPKNGLKYLLDGRTKIVDGNGGLSRLIQSHSLPPNATVRNSLPRPDGSVILILTRSSAFLLRLPSLKL